MSRSKDYDINASINKLKKAYSELMVEAFAKECRFDCVLGYAITEKGGIIDGEAGLKFLTKVDDGYKIVEKEYADKQTSFISTIFKRYGKRITPNLNWKDLAEEYLPHEYKKLLNFELEGLLERNNAWEMIAFAEHVPFAPISMLEDRIIDKRDSLKILAFAKDVKNANIKKLKKAIEKVGNSRKEIRRCEYKGDVTYEKVPIDHIGMFNSQFNEENDN